MTDPAIRAAFEVYLSYHNRMWRCGSCGVAHLTPEAEERARALGIELDKSFYDGLVLLTKHHFPEERDPNYRKKIVR